MNDDMPDRVIVDPGPDQREISIGHFTSLPLTERVHYLLADRVRFFRGERQLPTYAALRALMSIASDSARNPRGR